MVEQHIGRDQINIKRSRDVYIQQKSIGEIGQLTEIKFDRSFKIGLKSRVEYKIYFKLKDRHEIILIHESRLTKNALNPFEFNLSKMHINEILLIVDGETKINQRYQMHTLDYREFGFELINEDVKGTFGLGGLPELLGGKAFSLLIGDYALLPFRGKQR
jgi:hypothetical protein